MSGSVARWSRDAGTGHVSHCCRTHATALRRDQEGHGCAPQGWWTFRLLQVPSRQLSRVSRGFFSGGSHERRMSGSPSAAATVDHRQVGARWHCHEPIGTSPLARRDGGRAGRRGVGRPCARVTRNSLLSWSRGPQAGHEARADSVDQRRSPRRGAGAIPEFQGPSPRPRASASGAGEFSRWCGGPWRAHPDRRPGGRPRRCVP